MSYVLFISENKIKDSTAIGGNVDNEFLLPYIKVAQKKYIETKLGIQDALVHWCFYEALPFLRYKVMNNNVVSKTAENSTPLTREEAQDLREEIRNTSEFYTERLIDYIKNNTASFPEYTTNTGADVSPDTVNYYSGMNLEYDRNARRDITLDDFLTPDLN